MDVRLLFFATLRDRAGTKELHVDVPSGTTVGQLKARLAAEHPTLKAAMESVVIAVNREYAFDETVIPAGAELGLFPPVSGGTERERGNRHMLRSVD